MRYHELLETTVEEEILDEMPLPTNWDANVYKPNTSYAKRIEYAVERALKIGKGSSRSAFKLAYEGRETVLKVAHNKKGLAQNAVEASALEDYYVKQLGITIPMIDYDEVHDEPLWIHMEIANKASDKQLSDIMKCIDLKGLVHTALMRMGGKSAIKSFVITDAQVIEKYGESALETFNEYVDKLADLENCGINIRDFERAANWGIYNGDPVVVDVGFNEDVRIKHYS